VLGGNGQTSVQNEMLIVSNFPNAVNLGRAAACTEGRAAPPINFRRTARLPHRYTPVLREMSFELANLWKNVTAYFMENHPFDPIKNASFVYDSRKCVCSSTWI